jgi:hypothetical protein
MIRYIDFRIDHFDFVRFPEREKRHAHANSGNLFIFTSTILHSTMTLGKHIRYAQFKPYYLQGYAR